MAAENGDADAQVSLGYALIYGEGVRRDHQQALTWYRRAARQGNARALFNIGLMYLHGDVVAKSVRRAMASFEKAATQKHVAAMRCLARHYDDLSGEDNREKALAWLRAAAKAGDAESSCSLGVHFHAGDGVRKSWRRSSQLYRAAAMQGDAWACYLLGMCYRDGEGVARNRRWARMWFARAAGEGVADARKALTSLGDA